ncbi:DUF4917 family protein [Legionella pneumophila]
MTIEQWSKIKSKYQGASIILGNGASIAFSSGFKYDSLFDEARNNNFIDDNLFGLFQKFETTNFELVLYRLWQTKEVLRVLEEKTDVIDGCYSLCRNSLIQTVHKAHIAYNNKEDDFIKMLDNASEFLKNFKTVYSLNYDLILYWVIARGNNTSEKKGHIFKDCFNEPFEGTDFKLFNFNFNLLRSPHLEQEIAVLVFYPHGNLTLARLKNEAFHEIDLKICSNDYWHLNAIFNIWNQGKLEPVFISEGDSVEKKKRIEESEYLRTIYNKGFREIGSSLVIYGWSISEQDNHLLERLVEIQEERTSHNKDIIENIAVSVYLDGNEEAFIDEITNKLAPLNVNIDFYDSQNNCWCNGAYD